MKKTPAKLFALAALAAGLSLCPAQAQQAPDAPKRLAILEVAISSGDPAAAKTFLEDGEVLALAETAGKGAALKAKAAALRDLRDLLAMDWDLTKANTLSEALAIRIDTDKPLCKAGIGPEPEKLLGWIKKYYKSYSPEKTAAVKKAIRQWDVVFGTMTTTRGMSWAQATARDGYGVTLDKTIWEGYTIRERNAVINRIIDRDKSFLIYSDKAYSGAVVDVDMQIVVDSVRKSGVLSDKQLLALAGKPLADQVYLLGSYFDGSNMQVSEDLKMKVHAARDSMPKEVLDSDQRVLLGGMLNTAIPKELSGTKAGDRVMGFYAANGGLKIKVDPCDGAYSRFDAATGTIVLDSETIQQFMRMKGYTAASIMTSPAQLTEIAEYMSPMVVYESAHNMQSVWAKKAGLYKPHTQEDEIEAMALEGLYSSEKLDTDASFKKNVSGARAYSAYATKRIDVATEFRNSGSKKFADSVRQRYFSGLPSLDDAAAQVLGAVTEEIGRRAGLTPAARAEIDSYGLSLAEAMEMTPEELAGSVGEIRSEALAKIQADFSAMGVYEKHYDASDRAVRRGLKSLTTASASRSSGPPAL